VKLAFEFFRIRKLAAGFDGAVLRAQGRRIRADRFRWPGRTIRGRGGQRSIAVCRTQSLGDLQSGHQAFKVALLFWLEIARHCLFRLLTSVQTLRP
jgi:hypothetical protein